MKKFFLFTLAVLAFVACTQNDIEELAANRADAPETLTVGFEGDNTRIQLNEAQKTVWTSGDLVSVFYRSDANQKWQFQGETGERQGQFKRLQNAESTTKIANIVVAYPYSEDYFLNTKSYNIEATLPAVQHYAEDSYGIGDNLMVAQSEFTQFSLKNVCGWLKVQLTGNGEKVTRLTLKGNNNEQLAGLVYVDTATAEATLVAEMGGFSDEENGVGGGLVPDNSLVKSVTLNCGEGVELGKEATSFYFAVPPQSYAKGFTAEVVCDGYKPMVLQHSSAITIERNHIKPMASVNFNTERLDPEIIIQSSAITEFDIDGGYGEIKYDILNGVDGVTLNASCSAEWITNIAIDHSGRTVIYKVATNNTEETREAKITLTYGEAKAEITVKQKAAVVLVFEQNPAKPEISVKAAGGEGAIGYTLKNPIEGVEVTATADVDWLTIREIDTEKCRITYYASETKTKSERTGHITATYGDLSFVVTLIQDGGTTRLSIADKYTTKYVNYTAQTVTIPFDVLFPIEGNEPEATVAYTDGAGWITSLVAKLNEKTPEDEPATANEGATEEITRLGGNVTFEVPEHTTQGDRSATITIKYMNSSVTVNFTQKDNFADDVEYVATGAAANSRTGAQIWDFFLYEQDPTLGEIRTTITIQLPTAHANFIPDGTYSVAAGTIIPGTVDAIGYHDSTYRVNYMGGASPIKDAEFTIVNNKEAQTAKVEGYFVTQMLTNYESQIWNDVKVSFKWEGAVKNFMYADTTQVVTDWKEVYIQYIGQIADDSGEVLFTEYIVNGKTTKAAGSMPISFDLYAYKGAYSTTSVPAGRYNVVDPENKPTDANFCLSTSKVNDYSLTSGYVLIEDLTDGTQRFYYDVIDVNGSHLRGEYIGAITK